MAMNVAGYATRTSVVAGNAIDFCLSGNFDANFNLRVERVNSGTPSASFSLPLSPQPVPAVSAWEGFGWPVNYTFSVPVSWPPGLYQLVEVGSTAILRFVVRPPVPGQTSKILLQVSFMTPQVYSANGGKSLYDFNSASGRASRVSFDRSDGLPDDRFEPSLLDWLEKEGYAVECCSSIDLHDDPTLLSAYECLLIAGHDEYWTKEMRDEAEQFIADGGNVIVLSGNTCYRQVRLEQNNRMIIFYKYAGQDSFPDNDRATVAWSEPPVNRPRILFWARVGRTELSAGRRRHTRYIFRLTGCFKGSPSRRAQHQRQHLS